MEVVQRAKNIKLLILDVDGVLTDGGLYYSTEGQVMKRFNVQDGLGIKVAQAAGLEIGVISGLNAPSVERRVRELGITAYYPGYIDKVPCLMEIMKDRNLVADQIAFLGDDWVDAGIMRHVGLPMAVANAQPEILDSALWVSKTTGGNGAVREAIRFILKAQDKLESIWKQWSEKVHD